MSKRNTIYLVAIIILLALNGYLFFDDSSISSTSFDDSLFTVADTSLIQSIRIENEHGVNQIVRTEKGWVLNDRYLVDQSFRNVLLSILNQIRVKRKIGEIDEPDQGTVEIALEGENRSFAYSSDPLDTRSYFILEGIGYQVEVPGYRDNVINIFELTEDQWRDRMVFNGSWRTIQNLNLIGAGEDLEISFNGQFFDVADVANLDSSAVVDYLNQFQFFQANEMISSGKFPQLDSLMETEPMAQISIDDIQFEEEKTLFIYPSLPGQSYHLVTDETGNMMVFAKARIDLLLKRSVDFEAD